jgi:hypothetical protein
MNEYAMRRVEVEMCQFVLTLNTVVGIVYAGGPNKRVTLVFFFSSLFFVSSFVDAFSVNFSGASSNPVKSSLFQRGGQRN